MKILIDFDNCISNSAETVVNLYKKEYKKKDITYNSKEIEWDFTPYILKEHLSWALRRFTSQEFYDNLELMPNCKEVLERLSKEHELIIVTKKHPDGVSMNDQWIRNNLPFIERVVYLRQDSFDKSLIQGDIIIDDKIECMLGDQDRKFGLLFGDYTYNYTRNIKMNYLIRRTKDWIDVEKFINCLNNR